MESTGYVALSSQMVLQQQLDIIANNVANLATPAFKGEELIFVELVETTETGEISYVQDLATVRDLAPGPMTMTSNSLDLALPEEGYFVVQTVDGERYTRAGNFTLDADGQIVTAAGHPLLDDGGAALQIAPETASITVATDGTVSTEQGEIGRIQIVTFLNEQALLRRENNLYDANGEPPVPAEDAKVVQGAIEGSNVLGVLEMTRLISTVRSYQAAQTLAEESNQTEQQAIEALVDTTV